MNHSSNHTMVWCGTRVSGKLPELWDASTGRLECIALYQEEQEAGKMPAPRGPGILPGTLIISITGSNRRDGIPLLTNTPQCRRRAG